MIRIAFAVLLLRAVPSVAAAEPQSCTFTLSRTTIIAGPEGPIFARTTVTPSAPGCQWNASTTASWMTVDTSTRTGTGDQGITLAPNTTGATRIGTVTVAGQTVNVTQQATACVTSLTPNALTFPYPGFGDPSEQSKQVTVSAPADCHWQHSPWPINVFPNPTLGGVGTQVVNVGIITILPGQSNTLNLGIGSLPLTMTRLDPPCVFTLSPSNPTVSVNGGSGVINVTGTGTDCSFTATVGGVGLSIVQSGAAAPATVSWRVGGPVRSWAICDVASAAIVGSVELQRLDEHDVNLSYSVFPPWRRRGIGTRAAELALEYAATTMAASRAIIKVLEGNVASIAVARHLGARLVDTSPSDAGGTFLVFHRQLVP